ncbi:MAG TPA: vanadium-dependent haloperoxidase [Saprospiraceae bacterium]|nr:vanadium-dependent haloperoxidase [Saprospiraceae bacterium]
MCRIITLVLIGFTVLTGCKYKSDSGALQSEAQTEPRGAGNLAYRWAKVALAATANNTDLFKPRPTVTSRYLALIHIAAFDAWSRYDASAVPVYLTGVERRPAEDYSLKNKETAISYAFYHVMREYYYTDSTMFLDFMVSLGLDPNNTSIDPASPIGIGNLAARAVIEARRKDGSNQYGDEPGSNGEPYFDYTNYQPVNTPDKCAYVDRWQPKYFADGKGGRFAPSCLTPHWPKVKPIALKTPDQLRPPPPPKVGSEQMDQEVKELVDMQANLTYEQKALVEFMRDGPRSVQQAGHWLIFAQYISVRDSHNLDEDIKMYFLNQCAAMDAFIAAWEAKMYYDNARPYALVHHYYKDKIIKGWASPEKGTVKMKGKEWRPYSPDTFLCPPFPAYVSGHSCVSGACSRALQLYTGSDMFGQEVKLVPGALTELPENFGDTITMKFPTLTQTAEMAGISRVLGGYHVQADNIAGLELGRNVAQVVWEMYKKHVGM